MMINSIFTVVLYLMLFQIPFSAQTNSSSNLSKVSNDQGLMFDKEINYRVADSSYSEVIQLIKLSDKTQAMQFRILLNKSIDDSTVLIFNDIQKGSDLSDPGWTLDYNMIKGSVTKNAASKDEIFVLLYSQNLDGGLLPGDYYNLFIVSYRIPALSIGKKEIKSTLKISNAEASTSKGNAIDIKSNRDEIKIIVKRK
jgi:hypothetical protein